MGTVRMRMIASGALLAAVFAVQAPPASAATACTTTISGKSIPGDVFVPTGTSCTLVNDKIAGNVTVSGRLTVGAAATDTTTISGNLFANAGSQVATADGVTVGGDTTFQGRELVGCDHFQGNLTLKNAPGGGGRIGNLISDPLCHGLAGNLLILNNNTPQTIVRYSVVGDLIVRGNTDRVNLQSNAFEGNGTINSNTGGVTVDNNVFGGDLNCFANNPAPTGSGNTAQGSLNGQCAALG